MPKQQHEYQKIVSGRPAKIKTPEELWEKACEYFEWCDANPITVEENKGTRHVNKVRKPRPYTKAGFELYCNLGPTYLNDLEGRKDHDFSYVLNNITKAVNTQMFNHAAIGVFRENLVSRYLHLRDTTEVQHSGEVQVYKIGDQEIKF
jgi:hypothetical protein